MEIETANDESKFIAPNLPPNKKPEISASTAITSDAKKAPPNVRLIADISNDYEPPSWSEQPDTDHEIEILSNGSSIRTCRLADLAATKSFLRVGRAENCDIVVTGVAGASRIHCYLQFGESTDGRGWYAYDVRLQFLLLFKFCSSMFVGFYTRNMG